MARWSNSLYEVIVQWQCSSVWHRNVSMNARRPHKLWVFTTRARRCHAIKSSVCQSVCDVQVCFSHRLEYLENNFTADYLKVFWLGLTPTSAIWSSGNTPKVGCNTGRVSFWAENLQYLFKRGKIEPSLLWRTNGMSHTGFRFVPKSMTLDNLERPIRR